MDMYYSCDKSKQQYFAFLVNGLRKWNFFKLHGNFNLNLCSNLQGCDTEQNQTIVHSVNEKDKNVII